MSPSFLALSILLLSGACLSAADLTTWTKPSEPGITATKTEASFASQPSWLFLQSPDTHTHLALSATLTIDQSAKHFSFFGSSWSVWPDATFGDQGYEAGLLLRAGASSGYRVQVSHRYQNIALVKYPVGGYLRVVPCKIETGKPITVKASAAGDTLTIHVNGTETIRYRDFSQPLAEGRVGIGASSGAKVTFKDVKIEKLVAPASPAPAEHAPKFAVRKWLGGRPWVFDGDEPILLLPVPEASSINNVKLRPGHRPQLSWNSHWDISNQGAYPEGENRNTPIKVGKEGGKTLEITWTARQVKDRFETRSRLTVGYDEKRSVYTYDVDSELEVLGKEPFHFKYGYDFEHHTPLDPFRWQYLLVKREPGPTLERRPVYPIDPGPMSEVEQDNGLRLWYGRHNEKMLIAPAVEYSLPDAGKRRASTAVCAAFYDTGVSLAAETAKPGSKVKVRYRYTGYPAAEADMLFKASKLYDSPMLDPEHHYIFAEKWPKVTFDSFEPMSETWIYGRKPFMTGHNQRPTYELARRTEEGTGYGMKLGAGAFGAVSLPTPADLAAGRYALIARAKSDNAHGPGGRIELSVTEPKTGKEKAKYTHFINNGTFPWKTTGFVFEVPSPGCGLTLGLGNSGTGEVIFSEVEFRRLEKDAPLPAGVSATPAPAPKTVPAPPDALADYRMEEQKGHHALDSAKGLGTLELANVGWVKDDGRPALKFSDNTEGKTDYPRGGNLFRSYLSHPSYMGKDTVPVALAGMHGGGMDLKAFTISSWIKPAATMGKAEHGGKGDIVGLGGRRVILRLVGQKAPYDLSAAINVNDVISAGVKVPAERWTHVAVTGEPTPAKSWKVRLYVDGKKVKEGEATRLPAPTSIPPSLVLGAEIFYFHDAYYRGLIGRTTVFGRCLTDDEVAALAK